MLTDQLRSDFNTGDRMLIVDEAQYLDQADKRSGMRGAALEWLRALAERSGCRLVFVGDLSLPGVVAKFPQLDNRMRRPVVVRASSPEDVAAVADAIGVTDPDAIRALTAIARRPGALRNVDNVIRVATLFNDGNVPGATHVAAAIADLGLAPKGGRAWPSAR